MKTIQLHAGFQQDININIVECKFGIHIQIRIFACHININIVECKYYQDTTCTRPQKYKYKHSGM